jgi:hypothetical protein
MLNLYYLIGKTLEAHIKLNDIFIFKNLMATSDYTFKSDNPFEENDNPFEEPEQEQQTAPPVPVKKPTQKTEQHQQEETYSPDTPNKKSTKRKSKRAGGPEGQVRNKQ